VKNAFLHYKRNFKAAIAFALLLVFVPVFSIFESVFVTGGSMFLDYNVVDMQQIAIFIAALLLFLVFYSFFMSIIVFSVRKDLSKVKLQLYLHEMIQKFTLKLFVFFLAFSLLLYAAVLVLLVLGADLLVASLLVLVVSLFTMFVPQSIVVDEEDVLHAVMNNLEFIGKNPKDFVKLLVVGCVLLALSSLIGELVDSFYLVGAYVSLFLALVFVLPFLECMKTRMYMMKFELIRSPHLVSEIHKKETPAEQSLKDFPA